MPLHCPSTGRVGLRRSPEPCSVLALGAAAGLLLVASAADAQQIVTPGWVFAETSTPNSPLDPNNDRWTSKPRTPPGFQSDDVAESEVPFIALPLLMPEPGGDSGSTGFIDLVDTSTGGQSTFILFDRGTDAPGDERLLFRLRLRSDTSGGYGFSFLFDTDGKFGRTGEQRDSNAVAGNPGFEGEILIATSSSDRGIILLNVDGRTVGTRCTHYAGSERIQRSWALTRSGAERNLFLDAYLDFRDLAACLGIDAATRVRVVATATTNPSSSLDGTAEDIGGIPDGDPRFMNNDTAFEYVMAGIPNAPIGDLGPGGGFDLTPPDTSIDAGPAASTNAREARFTLSSAEAGVTFECSLDGAPFTPCASPVAFADLNEGAHAFAARARDLSGNVDRSPAIWAWKVDTAAPPPPTIAEPATSAVVAPELLRFRGSSEPGSTVALYVDGASVAIGTATADSLSQWLFVPTVPLGDGEHRVHAVAIDVAGNSSGPSPERFFAVATGVLDTTIRVGPPAFSSSPFADFTFASSAPAVTFECSLDGAAFTPCSASATFSGLAETAHALAVRAVVGTQRDASPAHWSWTVDTTPPRAPVIEAPITNARVATTTPTIAGSAPLGTTVLVTVGTTEVGRIPVDLAGRWSLTVPFALASGPHTASARASDRAGNLSPITSVGFVIDLAALDTFILTGPRAFTNASSATFDLHSTNPTAAFECSLDGVTWTWCLDPATFSGLADGNYLLSARARLNPATFDPSPARWPWTVDRLAPGAPTITEPTSTAGAGQTPLIEGTAEAGSVVTVLIDDVVAGRASVDDAGSWSFAPSTSLGEGTHRVSAYATDTAGNHGPPCPEVHFRVDVDPPETWVVSGPPPEVNTTSASFQFGSDEAGVSYECALDGALYFAPCDSQTAFYPLSVDSHILLVRARDQAGNVDLEPAVHAWTIDQTAPTAPTIHQPDEGATVGPTPTVSGAAEPHSLVTLLVGANIVGSARVGGDGLWSLKTSVLEEGPRTLVAFVTDPAGNEGGTASRSITVDATAPTTTFTATPPAITPNSTADFAFEADEPVFRFLCRMDGVVLDPCTPPLELTDLSQGPHTFEVYATDVYGNAAQVPASHVWTVDWSPPEAPSIFEPAALAVVGPLPRFMGGAEPGSTVTLSVDGSLVGIVVAEGGAWSLVAPDALLEGEHQITATATDLAGNTSVPSEREFRVDATPPVTQLAGPPSPTNATTASFRLVVPGETVTWQCQLDGIALAQCGAETERTGLGEGDHVFAARATDAVGNVEAHAATWLWTVDLTAPPAPEVTEPLAASLVPTATPTIVGRAEPLGRVTVTIDGTIVGTPDVDAAGDWSLQPAALADGARTVVAKTTDTAGNTGPDSVPVTFTVDTQTAAPVIIAPAAGAVVGPRPVFSGTAESGATVALKLDGVACGAPVAGSDGTWSLTAPEALRDGAHTLVATAKDLAGNVSPDATTTFAADHRGPESEIRSGPTSPTNATTASFVLWADEANVSWQCRLDDGAFFDCSSPATVTGLLEGTRTFSAFARDAFGNADESPALWTWYVDRTPPSAPAITAPANGSYVATATPAIRGTTEPGARLSVVLDSQLADTVTADAEGVWVFAPTSPLSEGNHTVSASATDVAGNPGPASPSSFFTVDTVEPETSITSKPELLVHSDSATFAFSSSETGVSYECSLDGSTFALCPVPAVWSGLAEAPHQLQVRARDRAGNADSSPAGFAWSIDLTAPEAPAMSQPVDGRPIATATPSFGGTAEARCELTLFVDGVPAAETTADEHGVWTVPAPLSLLDGIHHASASCTDPAGNPGPESLPISFEVRGGPLAPPVIEAPSDGWLTGSNLLRVHGTTFPGATVWVQADERVLGSTTAGLDGRWQFNLGEPLPDGSHRITATANDDAGRLSGASNPVRFVIDTRPPETTARLARIDPAAERSHVELAASESGSSFECRLDGDEFAPCASPFDFQTGAGDHTLEVRARDAAGNVDPTVARLEWEVGLDEESLRGGGCGCASTGGSLPLLPFALAALFALHRRRRTGEGAPAPGRTMKRAGFALAVVMAGTLQLPLAKAAQPARLQLDAGRLALNPAGGRSLVHSLGDVLPEGQYRLSLAASYEHEPLVYYRNSAERGTLLARRISTHLLAAWSPLRNFELDLQLPVILNQAGDDLGRFGLANPSSYGLGSPVLRGRYGLLSAAAGDVVDALAELGVRAPIGSESALAADGSFGLEFRAGAGRRFGPFDAGLQIGGVLRSATTSSGVYGNRLLTAGSLFDVGATFAYGGDGPRAELDALMSVPAHGMPVSGELLLGGRYPYGAFDFFALAGPGFGAYPGTPAFRGVVGVGFRPPHPPAAPPSAPTPVAPPAPPPREPELQGSPDTDADTLADRDDECPKEAGPVERKGCPIPDQDGDTIADAEDRCPTQKGETRFQGCPDTDSDLLSDLDDACPTEAGPAERKGCPLKDVDGDGLVDEADRCPAVMGLLELAGCPATDEDGDRVSDHLDNCKKEKGPASNQGCPLKKKQLVIITRDRLVIKDKVYFASGKATIQKRSFRMLQQVGVILEEHPEIARLVVEGHTDDRGGAALNRQLSQARAESVRRFLIEHGVAAERLEAKGYGPDRPASDNTTAKGREANRRVEFVIAPADGREAPPHPVSTAPGT